MLPDQLSEEEHEELLKALDEFYLYRVRQTRAVILGVLFIVVMVCIGSLMWQIL